MKQYRSTILFGVVLFGLALAFAFKSHILRPNLGEALADTTEIRIRAESVPLNTEKPEQLRVGALEYVAGWALSSPHKRFGGFSGLVVEEDGSLLAISDQGDWFTAHFNPAAKEPLSQGDMHPFTANMPEYSKVAYDAESLIKAGEDYLVSFEQDHRLMLARPDGWSKPWPQGEKIDFTSVADNSGMEAITWLSSGKLLALTERGVDTQGRLRGWLVSDTGVDTVYFKPAVNFSPTDAALLPNGDVLLLMRFFSIAEGTAIKLVRIKAQDIKPGATLEGEELAHMSPPFTVDNMEGLDVGLAADGTQLVYMLSDDNFNPSQRTLLLVFALQD
ncbi:MAG: esterase-like activity of phytase family protein [Alphaproteobacteria bacterium]|nr:esterase-like activity of phytase family protein [Alphaproteobacteria bacterium]